MAEFYIYRKVHSRIIYKSVDSLKIPIKRYADAADILTSGNPDSVQNAEIYLTGQNKI